MSGGGGMITAQGGLAPKLEEMPMGEDSWEGWQDGLAGWFEELHNGPAIDTDRREKDQRVFC